MSNELKLESPRATGASFARGQSKQDYATPPDFMAAVRARFGPPEIDLAATGENKKAPRWLGPGSGIEDALTADWTALDFRLGWLNPPFGNIAPWAKKCAESAKTDVRTILFLVPASVGSCWFRDHVAPFAWVHALCGRICFDGIAPFPKDCMLCEFRVGIPAGFSVWTWRA